MRYLRRGRRQEDRYEEIAVPEDDALDFSESGPEREYEAFVPVEAEGYREYRVDDDEETEEAAPRRRFGRLRIPRPALRRPTLMLPHPGIEISGGMLLLVAVLIAAGIFGTLLTQGSLRDDVETSWPVIVIAGAGLWMLAALLRRQVAAFLGASMLVGIGISALLDTQSIAPVRDTVLGIVLVAVGLGIAIRGFLLRQQSGGV